MSHFRGPTRHIHTRIDIIESCCDNQAMTDESLFVILRVTTHSTAPVLHVKYDWLATSKNVALSLLLRHSISSLGQQQQQCLLKMKAQLENNSRLLVQIPKPEDL